jgi:hypothetical protein
MSALGDGWLGKFLTALIAVPIAAIGGWWARRPAESAAMSAVVDHRIEMVMGAQVTNLEKAEQKLDRAESKYMTVSERCDVLEQRIIADRRMCDEQLDSLRLQLTAATANRVEAIASMQAKLEVLQLVAWPGVKDDGTIGSGLK